MSEREEGEVYFGTPPWELEKMPLWRATLVAVLESVAHALGCARRVTVRTKKVAG